MTRFDCRNCDVSIANWNAANEHADDEDHIVDVWEQTSTVLPSDINCQ